MCNMAERRDRKSELLHSEKRKNIIQVTNPFTLKDNSEMKSPVAFLYKVFDWPL